MEEKIKKLKIFIEKYGEDYVQDGTKRDICNELENGDIYLAHRIMKAMDQEWVERTVELGKFVTFTDSKRPSVSEKINQEYYSISYMDHLKKDEKRIPVLRHVVVRNREILPVRGDFER